MMAIALVVAIIWLQPTTHVPADDGSKIMITSYYNLIDHEMANGQVFDGGLHIAAHKDLPLGTKLRLRNPITEKSLEVRVTDRGPFKKGRDLDISEDAARFLGFHYEGFTPLQVVVLELPAKKG